MPAGEDMPWLAVRENFIRSKGMCAKCHDRQEARKHLKEIAGRIGRVRRPTMRNASHSFEGMEVLQHMHDGDVSTPRASISDVQGRAEVMGGMGLTRLAWFRWAVSLKGSDKDSPVHCELCHSILTSVDAKVSKNTHAASNARSFVVLPDILYRACVWATVTYIVWILAGTVAWVSHLGSRLPWISTFLPARGAPLNHPADGIYTFLSKNIPVAACFVLPHSLLLPHKLRPYVGRKFARLAYCMHSAATLHFLLCNFTPLQTPIIMELPIPSSLHNALSLGCLIIAMMTYVGDRATLHLLGAFDALGEASSKDTRIPPAKMDAITWMGMTVYEFSGSTGFVLFTGLSILPRSLSLGDCITRGIAALYLRVRSKGFRDWVGRIEGAHLLTWLMRGTLLACAIRGASGGWIDGIGFVFGALFMAAVLRWAENDVNVNKVKNAWREGKTQLSLLLKA